jgi:hypothetical protein
MASPFQPRAPPGTPPPSLFTQFGHRLRQVIIGEPIPENEEEDAHTSNPDEEEESVHTPPPDATFPDPFATTPHRRTTFADPIDDEIPEPLSHQDRMLNVLEQFARTFKPSRRSRVKEPDLFYGTDPAKLRPFLTQLAITIADRPESFQNDNEKVIFAISLLRGPAAEWFEPEILGDSAEPAAWGSDWKAFVFELTQNFGPHDIRGEAEDAIQALHMGDKERLSKYLVRFNNLAARTGWNDRALTSSLYRGLPARLKDDLSKVDYPQTLVGLRDAAQRLDQRYWKRQEEISRERRSNHSSSHSSSQTPSQASSRSNPRSSTTPTSSGNKSSGNNKSTSGTSTSTSNTPSGSSSSTRLPFLTTEGHLSAAEKQRRKDKGLCSYCAGAHKLDDCPIRKNRGAVRGRAASSSNTSDSTTATESKK